MRGKHVEKLGNEMLGRKRLLLLFRINFIAVDIFNCCAGAVIGLTRISTQRTDRRHLIAGEKCPTPTPANRRRFGWLFLLCTTVLCALVAHTLGRGRVTYPGRILHCVNRCTPALPGPGPCNV